MSLFGGNVTLVQGKTEYVPYEKEVNVTINRAPTDKSVELLNEMTKAAENNIVRNIKIDDNVFKGVVTVFKKPSAGFDCLVTKVRFTLNSEEYLFEIEEDGWNDQLIIEIIAKKLSEALLKRVTAGLFRSFGAIGFGHPTKDIK